MRDHRSHDGFLGTAIAVAAGLASGLLAGLVVAEWLGDVNPQRLRSAVRRMQTGEAAPLDPVALERVVLRALRGNPRTRHLPVRVSVLDTGLVELTGRVPTEEARDHAAETARAVAGTDAVINRLLVEGTDLPREAQ